MKLLIQLNQVITKTKINDLIDSQMFLLKLFNDDTASIDKFKQYISFKLYESIKPYLNYESLYDLDTSIQMFDMIFNNWFVEMYKSSMFESLFFNKNFYDYENIGASNNENVSVTNYQGFDVLNQDGQFTKNTNSNKSTGNRRIEYMVLLDTATKKWSSDFVNEVLFKMVKLIY